MNLNPTLPLTFNPNKVPKGRGDATGMGPMQTGKAWGSCNFDKLYMTGKL